jgi:hypothetical protein
MANNFTDLIGTVKNKWRIGLTGLLLSVVSGKLRVRNPGDSADGQLVASLLSASGDAIELNEDATSAGADWKFTIQRPVSGMGENRTVIFPTGLPIAGDALVVQSVAGGVIQLGHQTLAAGNDKPIQDTTSIVFGQSATTAMFTLPANALIKEVEIIIDTSFNGTPTLAVGIAGNTGKYVSATDLDLTQPIETGFALTPNKQAVGTTEAIIGSYSAGGATAGAARVIVTYVIPS